ncbi:MAG: putative virulence factor [Pseudomonadales bacterium]|nr:putative virulence factor [Pseudomonadales bacterium]
MSNINAEQLAQRWASVHEASGKAVDWIEKVRVNAPRLDNEAEHLILRLRRARNMAKRLGTVSNRPMTVGFFGLSQAGKSYLISALAAGDNGKLETQYGAQRLDFIDHVNPPGGGKEATGLVTRFSRTATAGPADYPIELHLFSEADLVKVFTNSFFKDFNHEKFNYEYNDQHIRSKLKTLSQRKSPALTHGINQDDVVDIWDYLNDRFSSSSRALAGYYWPNAVALAPYLNVRDRAELFSILWGEIPEFTESYIQFSELLASLNWAGRVYAPLESLVSQTAQGTLSQSDSIMNVDMLGRIGTSEDHQLAVAPFIEGQVQAAVNVSAAMLAALTVEMVFPLVEKTKEPIFEDVDLLDFPGYRGRKDHGSIDEMRSSAEKAGVNPVSELLLRGKVAYLFERYTDSQEMNVLIVCTPSDKQSDVEDVGPVLTEWINRTQGETPDVRAKRQSGLLWAITMFDKRVVNQLNMSEENLPGAWDGMMKAAMLEKFGSFAWMQEWVDQQPFCNTFLVRKPGFPVAFLELEGIRELGVADAAQQQLDTMKRTFSLEENVKQHVADPGDAWEAMLAANDGGIGRVATYLQAVAQRAVKLERLDEQLQGLLHELVDLRLSPWFMAEGAGEVEKKKKLAQQVFDDVKPRLGLLGEFMARLQLPEEILRSLYLRVDDEVAAESDAAAAETTTEEDAGAISIGGDFLSMDFDMDLSGGDDASVIDETPSKATSSSDAQFAKAVVREWINHTRSITEQHSLMRYLGLPLRSVETIADELVTSANRLDLENLLLETVGQVDQDATKRDLLVERQILAVKTLLGDFISWLGFLTMDEADRPASIVNRGTKIFQRPEGVAKNKLPELTPQPYNFSAAYLADWLVAFSHLAQANAGHSAGREITPEQNMELGEIIAQFTAN